MQVEFGTGFLYATPATDSTGTAITTPTPVKIGLLQDVSFDTSFDVKELYGQNKFPFAVAQGKGKVTGKAKFAQINGLLLNAVLFGQTLTYGIVGTVNDITGSIIPTPTGPYTITPTVPSSGTWGTDLGVRNAAGDNMTKVTGTPTTGQYAVAAGVYTFAAADTGLTVYIDYEYTKVSTTVPKLDIYNTPIGPTPTFSLQFNVQYQGKILRMTYANVVSTKFSMATKLDDFIIPEVDFSCFPDQTTGKLISMAFAE